MNPVAFVEKLPAWVHLVTLTVAALYVLFTGLAHIPRMPLKAKAFFARAGLWLGELGKDLRVVDVTVNPPSLTPTPSEPDPKDKDAA